MERGSCGHSQWYMLLPWFQLWESIPTFVGLQPLWVWVADMTMFSTGSSGKARRFSSLLNIATACREFRFERPLHELYAGTWRFGMGRPANRWRQGLPSKRTHLPERETRALSVAMPVSAYIWR